MINIIKNPTEPPLLRRHRTSFPGANYENGPRDMKKEIARFVIAEQYSICCYCMQRISIDTVRVEHKLSQSKHNGLVLDYNNMAGACSCSMGRSEREQHCDIYKGEEDFTFNLATIEDMIQYEPQGKIKSFDTVLNNQINDVLNLNHKELKELRRAVHDGVTKFLSSQRKLTKGLLNQRIHSLEHPRTSEKVAFCGVQLFFLKKRYARM